MAVLKKKITVRLHDTDAAGLLFFAHQLFYAHDIYEDLLQAIGLPMEELLAHTDFSCRLSMPKRSTCRGLVSGRNWKPVLS